MAEEVYVLAPRVQPPMRGLTARNKAHPARRNLETSEHEKTIMGEYAIYNGERIKIGTCESMYYLRADQVHLVKAERGNVNPITDCASIRFRFPFPDEDSIKPGSFDEYDRAVGVYGVPVSEHCEHDNVQFTNSRGYLISLPCPEKCLQDPTVKALNFGRNSNLGPVRIVQQKACKGKLVTVLECGGCGARWRVEELPEIYPVIEALLKVGGDFHREMASRIELGYTNPPQWVVEQTSEKVICLE